MAKSNNKPSYRLLLIDVLVFGILGLCIGLINMRGITIANPNKETLLFGLCIPAFICLMVGFIFYVYAEYKFNRLKLKNIFLYFAAIIAIINIIAVASLPNVIELPNGAEPLVITPMMRVYHLLTGFAFGLVPYCCLYLIPRIIYSRHYMNVVLYVMLAISIGLILISFIVEWRNYAGMINNHFVDIEGYALQSIAGHKNDFARFLLFGIFASILLRIRKKQARWILLVIPFYLFMLLTFSKITIVVATLTLLIYFATRIVMIAKKNKDNLIITLSIVGLCLLLSPLFIIGIVRSESGILFAIKNTFVNLGESAKNTFGSRLIIWDCAFKLLQPYQYIFGFGISTFDLALHNTYVPVAPTWEYLPNIYQAHNIFIEFIGKGGIILLGIYMFLYVYLVYVALKLRKKTPWLSITTIVFLFMSLCMGVVEPVYVCSIEQGLFMNIVVVFPIMSEYYLLMDKNEMVAKKDMVNQSKNIKKINYNSFILRFNKQCLIHEAKYIAYDLNSKIRL